MLSAAFLFLTRTSARSAMHISADGLSLTETDCPTPPSSIASTQLDEEAAGPSTVHPALAVSSNPSFEVCLRRACFGDNPESIRSCHHWQAQFPAPDYAATCTVSIRRTSPPVINEHQYYVSGRAGDVFAPSVTRFLTETPLEWHSTLILCRCELLSRYLLCWIESRWMNNPNRADPFAAVFQVFNSGDPADDPAHVGHSDQSCTAAATDLEFAEFMCERFHLEVDPGIETHLYQHLNFNDVDFRTVFRDALDGVVEYSAGPADPFVFSYALSYMRTCGTPMFTLCKARSIEVLVLLRVFSEHSGQAFRHALCQYVHEKCWC